MHRYQTHPTWERPKSSLASSQFCYRTTNSQTIPLKAYILPLLVSVLTVDIDVQHLLRGLPELGVSGHTAFREKRPCCVSHLYQKIFERGDFWARKSCD